MTSPAYSNVDFLRDRASSDVVFTPAGTGAVATTVQAKLRESVSVFDFMTAAQIADVQAGTLGIDVTDAVQAAIATGSLVFVPFGSYKLTESLTLDQGGLIGEGWGAGGELTKFVFYNLTSTTAGAINTRQATWKIGCFPQLENIWIQASSWNGVTGCLGYGLDVEAPILAGNVHVQGFAKSGVFLHHDASSNGPYFASFQNVRSLYNGHHGFLLGNGANVASFINCEGKWNGAPSFGVAPSVAGSYDGFYTKADADSLGYPSYTPEALTVIGCDMSYNSRYGWNFHELAQSTGVNPGYAEGNLVEEARCGTDVINCKIEFAKLEGNTQGFLNDQVYAPYFYRNAFFIGGKQVHPANVYDFIANPTQEDESGGTIQNAPTRTIFLSRSNTAGITTFLKSNTTPDGTAVDKATESALMLGGSSTYAVGIGSGGNHLKISDNVVRIPQTYYQATGTGWTSASVARTLRAAAPTTGTWAVGDIALNNTPTAGGFIGWVCVTAGTPGTWKTYGAISV